MSLFGLSMTHELARKYHKSPLFFSRFNFTRMKERGNTHYCFDCGGNVGFIPDKDGVPTNRLENDRYDFMKEHDPVAHGEVVIGNADKYDNVWDWLKGEIPADFPYVVTVPQV